MSEIEFAADPDDATLASASELARGMIAAEDLVAAKEAELSEAKRELATLRDELLPAAMSVIDQEEFTLTGGYKVSVGEVYVCGQLDDAPPDPRSKDTKRSLDERLAALRALDDAGHGDLARRTVTVTMGANSEALASELITLLRAHRLGNQLRIDHRRLVPWNVLSAFARDRVEAGDQDVDLGVLGVTRLRRAKIRRPKEVGDL